jgi:hypothetical protein
MDRPAPTPVSFQLGEITVLRIKETLGRAFPPVFLLPEMDRDALRQHAGWLVPSHYDPAADRFVMGTHSWVLRTKRQTILIDTCIGNQKFRPESPNFNMLDMPYLQRLADAGLAVEDIDLVFCTHMHVDHVGWNTRLLNGRWVPTFPRGRRADPRGPGDSLHGRCGALGARRPRGGRSHGGVVRILAYHGRKHRRREVRRLSRGHDRLGAALTQREGRRLRQRGAAIASRAAAVISKECKRAEWSKI